MARALVSWAFGMPNNNPAFASVLTGMFSLFGVIGSFSLFAKSNTAGAGVIVLLVSLGLLAYTIYVAVDTQFFQSNWVNSTNGTLRHGFIRFIGPILLGLSIIAMVIIVVVMIEAITRALTNS